MKYLNILDCLNFYGRYQIPPPPLFHSSTTLYRVWTLFLYILKAANKRLIYDKTSSDSIQFSNEMFNVFVRASFQNLGYSCYVFTCIKIDNLYFEIDTKIYRTIIFFGVIDLIGSPFTYLLE